jgi:integrase
MAGKLTARGVESLAKRKGRFGDGDGLYLRVLDPMKRVYWTYRYRLNGVDRERSIGAYPEMSLAEARAKHAEWRALVLKGIDPVGDKRAAESTAMLGGRMSKPTFGIIAIDHVETHESAWRSRKHGRQWRQTLSQYCQSIWSKPVDEIATQDVLACLKPIWNMKPVTASRLRGRIETIIDAAQALGHIGPNVANPARWKGHLQRLLPKPAKLTHGHHAAMPYAQLPAFMTRLSASDNDAARALRLTILTACRTSEVLGAKWEEIDFGAAIWRIPPSRMKIGEAHDVPLSNAAIAILRVQYDERGSNPHVFPGRPMRPLSTMAMSM